jgi:hypothetical protein
MKRSEIRGTQSWIPLRSIQVTRLTDYMRECLERWEDQQWDEKMRRDARRSGYREEDAVEIVRQYRREKRERRAAS